MLIIFHVKLQVELRDSIIIGSKPTQNDSLVKNRVLEIGDGQLGKLILDNVNVIGDALFVVAIFIVQEHLVLIGVAYALFVYKLLIIN